MGKRQINKQDVAFLLIWVLLGIFLFWKANYGYIFNDEPFMLSVGKRFCNGDRMFIHEWNFCQMVGLFSMPFIKIYTMITNSTEGLILFCRYVNVAWWLITSGIIYAHIKHYGYISIYASVYFLLFTPLDTMSITYNAISVSCIMIFSTYFFVEGSKIRDYLVGLALTSAVIVYPYLALCYFAYAVIVLARYINKNKSNSDIFNQNIYDIKKFLRITATASISAILFAVFVLHWDFQNVFDAISVKSTFDSPHEKGLFHFIKLFYRSFKLQSTLGTIILLISLIDKKRYERKNIYFSLQTVVYLLQIVLLFTRDFWGFNLIMLPITFVGLQAFILSKKRDNNIILNIWIFSIIYVFAAYKSSDTGMLAVSTAASVAGIGSFLILKNFADETALENKNKGKILVLIIVVIIVQLLSQFAIRIVRTYWDDVITELDTKITVGSAKGIITTKSRAQKYEDVYSDLKFVKNYLGTDSNFLTLSLFPSAYIDTEMNFATCSSWTYYHNQKNHDAMIKKLEKYFELFPEKTPDCIYIMDDDIDVIPKITFVDLNKYERIELNVGIAFINN